MKGGDLFRFDAIFLVGRREFRVVYVGSIALGLVISRYGISKHQTYYCLTAIATRYSGFYPIEDLLGLPARLLTLNRAPRPSIQALHLSLLEISSSDG